MRGRRQLRPRRRLGALRGALAGAVADGAGGDAENSGAPGVVEPCSGRQPSLGPTSPKAGRYGGADLRSCPSGGCAFRCAYHGWTYGLDGRLLNAPECEGAENFSFADFGLRPIRAEQWANWIFVNLDPAAEPLLASLGELAPQTERFGLEKMRFCERRDYVMQCNWKAYVDNYLEGYHLPSVHPGLNRELDYGSYQSKQFARHSVQYSPIRGPENEARGSRRYQAAEGMTAEYFWIFPNWMLNCYPDNVSLNVILPLGVEKTLAIFEWYFPADAKTGAARADALRFSDEIQMEDERICEVVQRNLRSRSYERGRYSVKQEKCVHHFHRLYAQAMSES